VRDVARSASRIGDRLQLADRQRAAAAEARALAAHLAAFNGCAFGDLGGGGGGNRGRGDGDGNGNSSNDNGGRGDGGGGDGGGGTKGGGSDGGVGSNGGVARVFHDPARSAEAAKLAQRLLRLAHDAADLERTERTAAAAEAQRRAVSSRQRGLATGLTAAAAKPASLAVAIDNLERYCDSLENRLLGAFSDAEAAGDARGMKEAAKTLGHFNNGASLAQRFIATRPMFMSVESLQEIESLNDATPNYSGTDGTGGAARGQLSRESDATSAAEAALVALEGFYAKAREAVAAEVATAREIFPRPAAVLAPLVHRVLEQRVSAALEAVLPPPPPPPVAASAASAAAAAAASEASDVLKSPMKLSRQGSFGAGTEREGGSLHPNPTRHRRFATFGGYGDTVPSMTPSSSWSGADYSSSSYDPSAAAGARDSSSVTAAAAAAAGGGGRPPGPGHFSLQAHLRILAGVRLYKLRVQCQCRPIALKRAWFQPLEPEM
jgi:hypothetical protein